MALTLESTLHRDENYAEEPDINGGTNSFLDHVKSKDELEEKYSELFESSRSEIHIRHYSYYTEQTYEIRLILGG